MTVRLLVAYGNYPRNANFSGSPTEEARLLRELQADTNTSLGTTYLAPARPAYQDPAVGGVRVLTGDHVLTQGDNGMVMECMTSLTITVPNGLQRGFGCNVLSSGTTSVAAAGSLLNGAATTLTRAAASNMVFAIVGRGSALNSYVVTGS